MTRRIVRAVVLLALVFAALSCPVHVHGASRESRIREALIVKLVGMIDSAYVDSVFSDPRFNIDSTIVHPRRIKAGYAFLFDSARVARGRAFLRDNRELLWRLYLVYGVEPEVLTAIFTVETDLGNFLGDHMVPNALYTNYCLARTAKKRAQWFKYLACFLRIAQEQGWDPFSIPSSYRGAFGYPQFMSCSFAYAVDWDGDGKIDLFSVGDGLASAANYLHINGWPNGPKEKTLRTYNRGRYGTAVLEFARLIRENVDITPAPLRMDPLRPRIEVSPVLVRWP